MPVTVDDRSLAIEELGLQTVGQVLAHLHTKKRLVMHLLIDGQRPDAARLRSVRRRPIASHHLSIETTEPAVMARQVLLALSEQLEMAERLRGDVVELLAVNQVSKATEKLTACMGIWEHAHDSVEKMGKLIGADLDGVYCRGRSVTDWMEQFADCNAKIRASVERREFKVIEQILNGDGATMLGDWQAVIEAMREMVRR